MVNEEKEESIEIEEPKLVENKEKEYLERLQRLQAEFENYQKRVAKERIENLINANAKLITELLPILDDFELSLEHNKDEGVVLIYESLRNLLKEQGLEEIDNTKSFNPEIHEALIYEEGEDNKILGVIQKGYTLNGKLLRASKVKISKVRENQKT